MTVVQKSVQSNYVLIDLLVMASRFQRLQLLRLQNQKLRALSCEKPVGGAEAALKTPGSGPRLQRFRLFVKCRGWLGQARAAAGKLQQQQTAFLDNRAQTWTNFSNLTVFPIRLSSVAGVSITRISMRVRSNRLVWTCIVPSAKLLHKGIRYCVASVTEGVREQTQNWIGVLPLFTGFQTCHRSRCLALWSMCRRPRLGTLHDISALDLHVIDVQRPVFMLMSALVETSNQYRLANWQSLPDRTGLLRRT